jgi:hypothetical protein
VADVIALESKELRNAAFVVGPEHPTQYQAVADNQINSEDKKQCVEVFEVIAGWAK